MTTYLQVLSLDTVSCSPSVIVATESSRFLFDSGEGIQRLCVEHRARIAKLDAVHLTRLCPDTIGGLPGLCLTAADAGKSHISIVGPSGISSFWKATGHFMRRSTFDVSILEPSSRTPSSALIISTQKYADMTIHNLVLGRSHICYVCETPQLAGKFDVSKALTLKIPKGPMFAALKSGTSVTLADGTVINPAQVLEEAVPGRYVAIICSVENDNHTVLDELYSQEMLKRFRVGGDLEGRMDCMVHFSPSTTLKTLKYARWIAEHSSTTHIAIGRDICNDQSSFIAATRQNIKQHLLCPDFFSSMTLQDVFPTSVYGEDGFHRVHLDLSRGSAEKERKDKRSANSGSDKLEALLDSDISEGTSEEKNNSNDNNDNMNIRSGRSSDKNDEIRRYDDNIDNDKSNSEADYKSAADSVSIIQGAALMRFDILPFKRKGLVPYSFWNNSTNRDVTATPTSTSTSLLESASNERAQCNDRNADKTETKSCEMEVINVRETHSTSRCPTFKFDPSPNFTPDYPRVCTPSDPNLLEFWNNIGDNTIIQDCLKYAAAVRRRSGVGGIEYGQEYREEYGQDVLNSMGGAESVDEKGHVEAVIIESSISSGDDIDSSKKEDTESVNKMDEDNDTKNYHKSQVEGKSFSSYGYPKIQDVDGAKEFSASVKNSEVEVQVEVAMSDVIEEDPECSKEFEFIEKNKKEEYNKNEETEKINQNYNFENEQADLLKLCGSLGGSITFLGTACAIPSKYRNVSGILIHLPIRNTNYCDVRTESAYYGIGRSTVLLDAGEGTWQQMVRMSHCTPFLVLPDQIVDTATKYEENSTSPNAHQNNGISIKYDRAPSYSIEETLARNLKLIWISHPHADHHLGLIMILSERKRLMTIANKRESGKVESGGSVAPFYPVLLIAPPSVLCFLRDYCEADKEGYLRDSYLPISSRQFDKKDSGEKGDSFWCDTGDLDANYIKLDGDSDAYERNQISNLSGNTSTVNSVEMNTNKFGYSYEIPVSPSNDFKGVFGVSNRSAINWRDKADRDYVAALQILRDLGIDEVENVKVIHCPQAYGTVITLSDFLPHTLNTTTSTSTCPTGILDLSNSTLSSQLSSIPMDSIPLKEFLEKPVQKMKIVYSGDTRPSRLLCEVGRDCAVLIHEATFEDDEQGLKEASAKRHCTVGEAIQVGKDMHAYRLILTHFSQRYPSVPSLPPNSLDYVLLAFDFMRVSFQDLLWAPAIMPALIEAFPPGGKEDNENENDDFDFPSTDNKKEKQRDKDKEKTKKNNSEKDRDKNQNNNQTDNLENKKRKLLPCRCHEWNPIIDENGNTGISDPRSPPASDLVFFKQCEVCAPVQVGGKKKNKNKN